MSAIVNPRDILMQAAPSRLNPVTLPPNVIVPGLVPDPAAPVVPTGFAVSAAISHIFIEHDSPTFTTGHGYARTNVYGALWVGGAFPVFADAVKITSFSGQVFAHATNPALVWHLWITWQSRDGGESMPAGGTNGLVATTGQDVERLVAAMTGPGNPFTILAVDTVIDGVTYPAGTYSSRAFIADAQISRAKIKALAVDSGKIADAAIGTAKIGDAQITTVKIGDAQITRAKIANLSVDTLQIAGNAVTVPDGRTLASAITLTSDWQDILSMTMDTAGNPVYVAAVLHFTGAGLTETASAYASGDIRVRLLVNGVEISKRMPMLSRAPYYRYFGSASAELIFGNYLSTGLPASAFDVKIQAYRSDSTPFESGSSVIADSDIWSGCSMFALGLKK